MNNEEKILALLNQIIERQDRTDAKLEQVQQEQKSMRQEQKSMRQEQDELRQEMNERFDELSSSLKFAWQDIAIIEKRVKQHEKEFHNVV